MSVIWRGFCLLYFLFLYLFFEGTAHLHGAVVSLVAVYAFEGGWVGALDMCMPLGATVGADGVRRWSGAVLCRVIVKFVTSKAYLYVDE